MFNSAAFRGFFLGGLAAMLLALAFAPVLAFGATATTPVAAPAKPEVPQPQNFGGRSPLVIPAAAFRSDGFAPSGVGFYFTTGYQTGNGTNGACVMAPAYLPKFAIMHEMFASLYDNDAANNVTVQLWRVNNYTGATDLLAQAGTTLTDTAILTPYDASIQYPVVTYPDYSYYVTTCLPTSLLRLYSVRIYYDPYNVYLPAILRGN
jgi:hypothetical protein